MSEQNKALGRRFVEEVINKKNLAVVDELVAPDMIEHSPLPGQAPGAEGLKQIMGMFFAAFPDLHGTIEDEITEGDKLVQRMTSRGTRKGDFMGIAPTGKQVTFTEMHIIRIVNGKAVEHWSEADQLGMMQQLGVVPAPGG